MPRARRTQEERSAETRARLLDATLECLDELGYARTTTTEIAERAQVSRGAQLHHFPAKEDLVLAAIEHLFEIRREEFFDAIERLPPDADRASASIDLLWTMVGGSSFNAWLELAIAGRTDERLGRKLRQHGNYAILEIEDVFHQLFPAPQTPNPFYELAPRFAFALLQGLAVDRLLVDQPRRAADELLNMLKVLSTLAIPRGNR
jgi:AcrR family transcriptional regulator